MKLGGFKIEPVRHGVRLRLTATFEDFLLDTSAGWRITASWWGVWPERFYMHDCLSLLSQAPGMRVGFHSGTKSSTPAYRCRQRVLLFGIGTPGF